ncbi:MAG TPA: hypothetical protein VMZ27_01640 [Candidatus Saccharimonadales bacterium]|nr:hypothetical protein [Candidatus Saccharimonadales bacterium]
MNIQRQSFSNFLGALLLGCFLLSPLKTFSAQPVYEGGWDSIQKISRDLYRALNVTNRLGLLPVPILKQDSRNPSLQPYLYPDGSNSWQAISISSGYIDLLNYVAAAKALEKVDRGSYERLMGALKSQMGEISEIKPISSRWSLPALNEQASYFNQMSGAMVALEMAHHYLGHYRNHESALKNTGNKIVPFNSLLTPEEWETAVLKAGRNALDCGLSVEGLKALLDVFSKPGTRQDWAIQFVPPGADVLKVSQALTTMERDFFVMDNK